MQITTEEQRFLQFARVGGLRRDRRLRRRLIEWRQACRYEGVSRPKRYGRMSSRPDASTEWAAPGSEDTELGVLMGPEVGHGETQVYARVQA